MTVLELKTHVLETRQLISKSLYPLSTLLILCFIPSFEFPCWIATTESSLIHCARKLKKIIRLLIGCSNSAINTLIGLTFFSHSRTQTKDKNNLEIIKRGD